MTYSIHEKALAIHRVIKCSISIWPSNLLAGDKESMEAGSDLVGAKRCHADDLMLAVKCAFKSWEQRWMILREQDILEAKALELDTSEVAAKLPRDYYHVPESKERAYAEAYDIIQRYRAEADHGHGIRKIIKSGHDPVGVSKYLLEDLEARKAEERKRLSEKLGIN